MPNQSQRWSCWRRRRRRRPGSPCPRTSSIMPSMPMFTTPDRSHHRPAMAPSAIGVLSRRDSTRSCITLVSPVADSASARTKTSGMKQDRRPRQRAAGDPVRPPFEEGRHRDEDEEDADRGDHGRVGRTTSVSGSGGGSNVSALSAGSRFGRDEADEVQPEEAEQRRRCVWRRPKLERALTRGPPPGAELGRLQRVLPSRSGGGRSCGRSRRRPRRAARSACTMRTASIERPRLLLHEAGAGQHRTPQERR